jgi:hypothetical protein
MNRDILHMGVDRAFFPRLGLSHPNKEGGANMTIPCASSTARPQCN